MTACNQLEVRVALVPGSGRRLVRSRIRALKADGIEGITYEPLGCRARKTEQRPNAEVTGISNACQKLLERSLMHRYHN